MIETVPAVIEKFENAISFDKAEVREFIASLETYLKTLPQAEIPLKHYFSKGVYGREIAMEKGTLLVGKIHKHQTMNVLMSGEVSVLSIDGVMRIKAPFTFVSSPGAKRVIFANEASVWTVFHGTEETDLEKIEDEFIAKDYSEVQELEGENKEALCLG